MFWVVQDNLYDEKSFVLLLDQLERQNVQFELVKLIPFDHVLQPDVNPTDNVFVCGSTSLGNVAKSKGWTPGYFDNNLNMEIVTEKYGDQMLNSDMIVSKFKDVSPEWDRFFIRPCSDKKEFAGQVMNKGEFSNWQEKIIVLDGTSSWTSLTGDDDVMIAPVVHIFSEYRFFVVDGKVITGSLYKQGNRVYYSNQVDKEVYDYAQSMVGVWQPDRAFCLDVAVTEKGYSVIEINSINSAGFYECDMGKFVNAINEMKF